ncbi:MAG TPA: 3-oxoadipate enol-lactonase [Burkholderiales bacterium]|jgi:3-oxoadipate enol-lactonase|nr:3-oxoadipate enol-lactonase [Burkholderiales bacterium]
MKANSNGVGINYTVEGKGPWVVLSHSLACNYSMWDEQAAALKRNYRVLRFDTRGHGGSDAPGGAYSLKMLAEDLLTILDDLDIDEAHFVGLSMGGMIGMTFALSHPGRFLSLVLCDTSSRIPAEAAPVWEGRIKTATEQGMEPLVEPTLQRWFTEPFYKSNKAMMKRVGQMIRATKPAGYIGCCHAIPKIDLTDRLGAIACPIQIIVGEQDVGTPVAMSRAIHDATPGSELVIIPSASHLSNLEQPELFNKALGGFLAKHG